MCEKCMVRMECLSFALETRAEFGVWGGLNVDERRSLLRRPQGWKAELAHLAAGA